MKFLKKIKDKLFGPSEDQKDWDVFAEKTGFEQEVKAAIDIHEDTFKGTPWNNWEEHEQWWEDWKKNNPILTPEALMKGILREKEELKYNPYDVDVEIHNPHLDHIIWLKKKSKELREQAEKYEEKAKELEKRIWNFYDTIRKN